MSVVTAEKVEDALRKRYPSNAYALLFQVPNATGLSKGRTADAIAFSLWPSRGLTVEGIEIKVSRADWRKELEDPTKADAFARHCHRWWIAAPPGIVETGELPANWGLLELSRGVLRQKVEAPLVEDPQPIPHTMWCAIMRLVARIDDNEIARLRNAIRDEIKADIAAGYQNRIDGLNGTIQRFVDATGVDIRHMYKYQIDELVAALTLVHEGRDQVQTINRVRNLAGRLREVADEIDSTIQEDGK